MNILINGSIMCDHCEVLDGGEYICKHCGLVLGQEYVSINDYNKSTNIINTNSDLYFSVCNILDKLHLSDVRYGEEVCKVVNKYLRNYKYTSELKIGASNFYVLSLSEIPYQINKIARLVCLKSNDYKKLFKLIQVFPPKI